MVKQQTVKVEAVDTKDLDKYTTELDCFQFVNVQVKLTSQVHSLLKTYAKLKGISIADAIEIHLNYDLLKDNIKKRCGVAASVCDAYDLHIKQLESFASE